MKKISIIVITILIVVSLLFVGKYIIRETFYPKKYENIVSTMSDKYEIDENLIYAIIKTESKFNKNAVSKANAKGLMQIIDETAIEISKKIGLENFDIEMLFQPEINIEIGTYYIRELYDKYKNKTIAIIAYNAGQGNVDKWISDKIIENNSFDNIPYKETSTYWKKVLREYNVYNSIY